MSFSLQSFTGAYAGINRNMWLMATAMFINRCGGMVLLFMSVYLTRSMQFTIPQAGVVMAMFGTGSLVGAFLGGKLVDRIGYYPVLIWSLLLSGAMLLILGQMQQYWLIALFTFLVTATGDAFRPANSASISNYSSRENYPRAIALNRLAMNLGFTIGPVLGGILASVNYQMIFIADGLTCIAAGLFIYFVLPAPVPASSTRADAGEDTGNDTQAPQAESPYRDKLYLFFLLFTALYATTFFQFMTSLPLYYKINYQLNEKHIGWLMAFNGIGVSVIEMFLIYHIQNRWTQFKFISLGILLLGLGFLVLLAYHDVSILVISMLLITISEMLAMPFMSTFAINRAPKSAMGRYMALYSMSWSVAQIASPMLGTRIIASSGFPALWCTLGAMAFCCFLGFRWLEALQRKQQRLSYSVPA